MRATKKKNRQQYLQIRNIYRINKIQGVLGNLTVERRLDGHLRSLTVFAAFASQPSFRCMILVTVITKIYWSSPFQNTGDIKNFVQISIKLNLKIILHISGNIKGTKKGRPSFGNARTKVILLLSTLELKLKMRF